MLLILRIFELSCNLKSNKCFCIVDAYLSQTYKIYMNIFLKKLFITKLFYSFFRMIIFCTYLVIFQVLPNFRCISDKHLNNNIFQRCFFLFETIYNIDRINELLNWNLNCNWLENMYKRMGGGGGNSVPLFLFFVRRPFFFFFF